MPLLSPSSTSNLHRGWRRPAGLAAWAALLLAAVCIGGGQVEGATSGTTQLFTPASGGSGRSIGDFVSSTDAMATYYSFFVEVPAGTPRLVVELFDADANNNGAESGGRDRERTNNSAASNFTYRIYGPDGVQRPGLLANGTANTPAGANNAWLALYDLTSGSGDYVRDEFNSNSYGNNNGNVNWLGNWTETNDNGSATSGVIFVSGGRLNIRDNGGTPSTIQRSANLSGWTNAFLSFDFQTSNDVDAGDQMLLQVSTNGTTWTLVDTFTGPFTTVQSRIYNLEDFITLGANTRIRFIENNGYSGNETFFVDNVQIQDTELQNGHWEVRIDGSVSSPGDDINAIGIRAHDGNAGSGGTELNVYYDSFANYGVNDASADRVYEHHPYVTSGCALDVNEFDGDGSGSYSVISRSGAFTGNSTGISGNNVWRNQAFTSWRTDNNAIDYGIWTMNFTASAVPPVPANSGNYYTVYLTNSMAPNSSTTAPSTQPTPNSFRVYLKTDAGTAPVKPYLEQQVRYGSGPGPNPPAVGQTTRLAVTVRLVNPTSRNLSFTGANVISNVPGSGVVYAGGAAVSQGTFSTPSMGGTGNITWNPGTVAAGGTALLAYQVNVTPTSSGQRLPVVATPASNNGTRATFVDETGNTSQPRATMTLGPLCELAVTADVLTPVVVSDLSAEATPAGTAVAWETASEVGGAGFNVYRLENGRYRKVNERLLPALSSAPQGGSYRFLDRSAPGRGALTYLIEEVDQHGGVRRHGPFTTSVGPAGMAALSLDENGYDRKAHAATPFVAESSGEAPAMARVKGGVPESLKIGIDAPGVYLVPTDAIADQLGMKRKRVLDLLATHGLALTDRNGVAVPWTSREAGLVFYGQGIDSPYARDNAYWLRVGPGLAMAGTALPPVSSPLAGSAFDSTVHAEADLLAATVVANDPESDYWYWSALVAADPTDGSKSFEVAAPSAAPLGTGRLRIGFKGASASGTAGEHHALVRVNGIAVGETTWEGLAAHSVELYLAAGIVQAGANTIQVEALLDSGVPFSFFYVDDIDLTYARLHQATGDTLAFHGGGAETVDVDGFTHPDISLFDVSVPGQPRAVQGAVVTGDKTLYRVTFSPATEADYVAVSAAAFKAPRTLEGVAPSTLRDHGAEYLVLTTAPLKAAAQELADLRAGQGLSAEVVDVAEIMNEWNGGVSSPHAIREFLAWRYTHATPVPRFVVLAGAGSFDYRDNLGLGGNLVPPLMAPTGNGLFAADNRYGDVIGDDGVMEIAVGRIPARTAAELSAYVAKIAAYESEPTGPWSGRALFLSDNPEGGVTFPDDSDRLASALPRGVTGEPISLGDMSLAAARAALFSALGEGVGYMSYVGHGGLDRMASEGLLTSADVPGLPTSSRLPVVSALTCIVNRFEVPGFSPLGVELLRKPSGGAVAVFAPTGLSYNAAVQDLGDLFFNGLHRTPGERLGEAARNALRTYLQLGSQPGMADIYTLLGDPALLLSEPPAPASEPSGPGD